MWRSWDESVQPLVAIVSVIALTVVFVLAIVIGGPSNPCWCLHQHCSWSYSSDLISVAPFFSVCWCDLIPQTWCPRQHIEAMKPVMQVNAMQPTFTPILYRCILLLPPLPQGNTTTITTMVVLLASHWNKNRSNFLNPTINIHFSIIFQGCTGFHHFWWIFQDDSGQPTPFARWSLDTETQTDVASVARDTSYDDDTQWIICLGGTSSY